MTTSRLRTVWCVLLVAALLSGCSGKVTTNRYGKELRARDLTTVDEGDRAAASPCAGPVGALQARGLVSMDYCTLESSCDPEEAKRQQCLRYYGRACRRCRSCGAAQMCDAIGTEVGTGLQVHCLAVLEGGACGSTGSGKPINRCSCYAELPEEQPAVILQCACGCRS